MLTYGEAWLRAFLEQASGFVFDDAQLTRIVALAERKLWDLFDVAERIAIANGRARIQRHDLPLTKGLRALLADVDAFAPDLPLEPLLTFLEENGVPGPLDDAVRDEIPRLMAALLLLTGRVIAVLEPENTSPAERIDRLLRPRQKRPTDWELDRAARVLGLTL